MSTCHGQFPEDSDGHKCGLGTVTFHSGTSIPLLLVQLECHWAEE